MGRGVGVPVGVVFGWAALVVIGEAGTRLTEYRLVASDDLGRILPWLALVVGAAVALGLLLGARRGFGAGAMVGAGLLMSAVGLAVQVLPLQSVLDMARVFEVPGGQHNLGLALWDGSVLLFGIALLIAGLMSWRAAAAPRYLAGQYPYPGPNPVPQVFGGPAQQGYGGPPPQGPS